MKNFDYLHFKKHNLEQGSIFIDFDHTISNQRASKQVLRDRLLPFGVTDLIWDQTYSEVTTEHHIVDQERQIKLLSDRLGVPFNSLHDIFTETWETNDRYVYQDAVTFIHKHSQNFNIYILTLGNYSFQKLKLYSSGISNYLTGAIYAKESKTCAIDEFLFANSTFFEKKLVFVDDRSKYFAEYQQLFDTNFKDWQKHIYYIWINRLGAKYSYEKPSADILCQEIKDLSNVRL